MSHFDKQRNDEFSVEYVHRLRFTRDLCDPANTTLIDLIPETDRGPRRGLLFLDDQVAAAWPDLTERFEGYVSAHADRLAIAGETRVVPGGEQCKNDRKLFDEAVVAIDQARLCRQSYVIVIGGGAVLDAIGFAASTVHRGVRLIRVPTTTLAQADGGIGVKNGINALGKKNLLGSFAAPWAVINDLDFLSTLSERDFRSGFSEVVKVALLKDAELFAAVERQAEEIVARDTEATEELVRRSALLHLDHITRGGDPFEITSSRPLDFGHWAAHKLEQLTDFELRHGEAVAIGVALDSLYSMLQGSLEEESCRRVLQSLRALGFELYHEALADTEPLLAGIEEFREHLGGRLTITLLEGIGRPYDAHTIEADRVRSAVELLRGDRIARAVG